MQASKSLPQDPMLLQSIIIITTYYHLLPLKLDGDAWVPVGG